MKIWPANCIPYIHRNFPHFFFCFSIFFAGPIFWILSDDHIQLKKKIHGAWKKMSFDRDQFFRCSRFFGLKKNISCCWFWIALRTVWTKNVTWGPCSNNKSILCAAAAPSSGLSSSILPVLLLRLLLKGGGEIENLTRSILFLVEPFLWG